MNETQIVNRAFLGKEIFTIDPGRLNGGIVKYTDKYEVYQMSKMNDFVVLVDFWKSQAAICKVPLVFIEKINTFSSDTGPRQWRLDKLKKHYTELISAIKLSGIPYVEVMPVVWQSYLKIRIKSEEYDARKNRFKDIAKEWFGDQKVYGWNADAFLMMRFAQHKLNYDHRWIISRLNEKK